MKEHISGYAGYVPGKKAATILEPIHRQQQAEIVGKSRFRKCNLQLGYQGYVFAIKPEALHGKSFHRLSKEVKVGSYYRNRPHFDEEWKSLYKDSFIDPS